MIDTENKDDILLVDDNPENLRVLANILQPNGYIIRVARSGLKAIESIQAKPPKLILLDIQMPEMDGYNTIGELKKDPVLADVPVIFVSALSGILDKVKAFKAGAVDYIEKPFHMDEVIARVKTHLTVRRQRDQLKEALRKVNLAQKKVIQSEKMASLGTLSAGIAHEINNPINFINAGASAIELDLNDLLKLLDFYESIEGSINEGELVKKIKKIKNEIDYHYIKENIISTVHDIKNGARRTEEIVKSLKRFSRIDGEQKFKVNINDEIKNNITIVKRLSKKKILYLLDLQEDLEIINGFPGQLGQLFMNLIMNSEQAIEKEGVIKVSTLSKKKGVDVLFTDNGCGIDKELGNQIFDPFLTTKEVGEGTGMGLSISYRIVENHGGSISYSSEVNVGTTFRIYLPYTTE